MVPGIILSAGRSVRMGAPKALLPAGPGGEPFVVRLARTLAAGGVTRVLIVGRADDEALRRVVRVRVPAARFVVNPDADRGGQLSSLLVGLDAIDGPDVLGVMAMPVDIPGVGPETIAALLAGFRRAPGRIIRAVHAGRHGHPVIFPRELFEDLRRADPAAGAKAVVRAHEARIVDVEVADAGVVDDLDTPEDYARAFGPSEGRR
jgi:CTP:molybdopterin cytidylyltransferase MocA